MNGPRSKQDALIWWQRVARKDIDADTLDWLATVARGLIDATAETDANRRRIATVRAVGLSGRETLAAHLARLVVTDAVPLVPKAERAKRLPIMVGLVINHVPGTKGEISPEALAKRIARAKKTAKR